MKEHSLFIAVSMLPKNDDLIQEAKQFNKIFNDLLTEAVELSKGVVEVKDDAVTKFTKDAENKTSFLTGMPIDTKLTSSELLMASRMLMNIPNNLIEKINLLNNKSLAATKNLIRYKTKIINEVLGCKLYTGNYPLLLEHIRREALFFVDYLNKLQNKEMVDQTNDLINQEIFWSNIMAEHSEFIRGYLDPTEEELMKTANNFAIQFDELNRRATQAVNNNVMFQQVTRDMLKGTKDIMNFKVAGTEGILACKVRSLIVPLLGDHVIREANHFLHILENAK